MEGAQSAAAGQASHLLRPERLMEELESIYKVLDRLVSVSRTLPPSQVQVVSLEDPLRMALAMVGPEAETNGHNLSLVMDTSPQVRAESCRLALAMRHLLYSALQSAAKGTAITVLVSEEQDQAVITISNEGEGIPAEVLTEIFDPYLTNSTHWLRFGLGLFEARQIIMSFEGNVDLESVLGKGTTLRAEVPLAKVSITEG